MLMHVCMHMNAYACMYGHKFSGMYVGWNVLHLFVNMFEVEVVVWVCLTSRNSHTGVYYT